MANPAGAAAPVVVAVPVNPVGAVDAAAPVVAKAGRFSHAFPYIAVAVGSLATFAAGVGLGAIAVSTTLKVASLAVTLFGGVGFVDSIGRGVKAWVKNNNFLSVKDLTKVVVRDSAIGSLLLTGGLVGAFKMGWIG